MKTLLMALTVAVLSTLLLLAGCSETKRDRGDDETPDTETVTTVNSICPVMSMKIDADKVPAALALDFEGKKVGFCCAECIGKWKALSDADKRTKLTAAMDGTTPDDAGESHDEHEH